MTFVSEACSIERFIVWIADTTKKILCPWSHATTACWVIYLYEATERNSLLGNYCNYWTAVLFAAQLAQSAARASA